ncbi:carbohydrate ABC transporter permease [Sinorhizobium americanum]|uniref:ABC transporter, permease n=1 Tax=Sinorhizobium americanum TaxID=194963 RepID=A0A1L3LTU1_9HYPH|nr:carbohydrate ABC transporter permease [Sinorhizobium americanum]APG93497.1 ABC transporter, permease [Sinorhizobium americanum]OAP44168.1 ABC transporter permease [Sinorhizobium americanum]
MRLGVPHLWLAVAAAPIVGFFALPIVYLAAVSLKTKDDVLSGNFWPTVPTFANWPGAFEAAGIAGFIFNSVAVSALAGLLTIALALPSSYAVLRLKMGGRWLADVTLSSYMAPPIVALIPLFFLLKATGLLNTRAGLVLVYGFANVPVAFWLLTPFLRRMPIEIEQAAAMDGAGPLRTLLQIVAPIIAPGVVATLIIVTVLSYNEFLFASAFTFSDATRTLPVGISLFQGDRLVNFGQMAAASLAGIAPIYLTALFMQRYLISGLAQGGVK